MSYLSIIEDLIGDVKEQAAKVESFPAFTQLQKEKESDLCMKYVRMT